MGAIPPPRILQTEDGIVYTQVLFQQDVSINLTGRLMSALLIRKFNNLL